MERKLTGISGNSEETNFRHWCQELVLHNRGAPTPTSAPFSSLAISSLCLSWCEIILKYFYIFSTLLKLDFTGLFPPLLKNAIDWLVSRVVEKKDSYQAFPLKHFPMPGAGLLRLFKIFLSVFSVPNIRQFHVVFFYLSVPQLQPLVYSVSLIPKLDYTLLNIKTCYFYFLASVFPWLSYHVVKYSLEIDSLHIYYDRPSTSYSINNLLGYVSATTLSAMNCRNPPKLG